MMTEVGALYMDDTEAARLRDYLLKGGFLWADDFWGEYAWHGLAESDFQGAAGIPERGHSARPLAVSHAVST